MSASARESGEESEARGSGIQNPPGVQRGFAVVPEGPGLGIELDRDRYDGRVRNPFNEE